MNHRALLIVFTTLALSAFYSCRETSSDKQKNDSAASHGNNSNVSDSSNRALQRITNQQTAEFILTSIEKGDEDPRTVVTAAYASKEIIIDTIMGSAQYYPKENWKEMEIPDNAISACGCWWAGGGDYFYLIPTANGVAVYVGYQDEGQEEPGYGWTLKKEITE